MDQKFSLSTLAPIRILGSSLIAEVVFAIPANKWGLKKQGPIDLVEVVEVAEEMGPFENRMEVGKDEREASGRDILSLTNHVNDVLLAVEAIRDFTPVDRVKHRRSRRKMERNIVMKGAARRKRDSTRGPARLNVIVGDVGRVKPPKDKFVFGVQLTR